MCICISLQLKHCKSTIFKDMYILKTIIFLIFFNYHLCIHRNLEVINIINYIMLYVILTFFSLSIVLIGLTEACLCACSIASVVSDSLKPCGLQPVRPLCPWDSPGKNIGVGCHTLLQRILLTQGSHLHLLHCRRFTY